MAVKYLAFILSLVICGVTPKIKLPDYITICKRYDPKLGDCWMKNYNAIMPHLAEAGIPEINATPTEPFVLEKISLDIGSGAVAFKAVLQDVKLWGLKDSKATSVFADFKKCAFQSTINVPYAYMEAKYSAAGKVLLFQFDSSGHYNLNLTNANLNITYPCEIYVRDGKEFLRGHVSDIDMTMESAKIHLENLFPNKDLNEAANEAFNANIDVIFQEMKPLILSSMAKIVTGILAKVYDSSIPIDEFYPLE